MTLQSGDRGPDVLSLQQTLKAKGFDPGDLDGDFGPMTQGQVKALQLATHLPITGVYDIATATALASYQQAGAVSVPQDALSMAESFEGYSAAPYQDSGGVWTIGYGSTRDVLGHPVTASTQPVTKVMAEGLMRRDMLSAATTIANDVHVPLTETERGALLDFVYNVGSGAFEGSTLLRLINAGDYEDAANQFERWDHVAGRVLAGLLLRRLAEKAEFLEGRQAQQPTSKGTA